MIDAASPGHFADVNQAFDAWLELHERTIAHHVYHFARDRCTDWVLLGDVGPRIVLLLLETQSDLLLFAIDLQNLDFDFLIDGETISVG